LPILEFSTICYVFYKTAQTSHEIIGTWGGSSVILHWNPWNKRTICKKGLARPWRRPAGQPLAFSPAASIPAKGNGLDMVYRTQGIHGKGCAQESSCGIWPSTSGCGGRGGAPAFPANGRRTRAKEMRTSTSRPWGSDSFTWMGRRPSERSCRRQARFRAAPVSNGSGRRRTWRREVGNRTGLGRGAGEGGGGATDQRNWNGMK
jgi:hypothetical protein